MEKKEFIKQWMQTYEPDTFKAGQNGRYFYRSEDLSSGIDLECFFEELLTDFEGALAKESEKQSNCNLPQVSVPLLSDLPENKPLYKDSGLWQLRTDDMEDVIIQQHSDESDDTFLEKCREIQREKERNER